MKLKSIKLSHLYLTKTGQVIKVVQLWPVERNGTMGRMYNKTDDMHGHFTEDWLDYEVTKETHPEEFL